MAKIIVGTYMVRYPLGGMLSHQLQYLVGFHRLGHDVYMVERAGSSNDCFDPVRNVMTDDCTYGLSTVRRLLEAHGLGGRWVYVNHAGLYHGLQKDEVRRLFGAADLFVDIGSYGAWDEEATGTAVKVLLDGEPGYSQIKMIEGHHDPVQRFDHYYTNGLNIGTSASEAPTAGRRWGHIVNPVVSDLHSVVPLNSSARAWTTVMNWRSHRAIEYLGKTYGQKDVEFERFMALPRYVNHDMEIAVSGRSVPRQRLQAAGWGVRAPRHVSLTYREFRRYVTSSLGEFSVAKNVFVALRTGWFSDRSAVYLACGRPVVLQDTGFSAHLPTGEGLFAVSTVQEAAAAIAEVGEDLQRHSEAARRIAREYLDVEVVLPRFLREVGVA